MTWINVLRWFFLVINSVSRHDWIQLSHNCVPHFCIGYNWAIIAYHISVLGTTWPWLRTTFMYWVVILSDWVFLVIGQQNYHIRMMSRTTSQSCQDPNRKYSKTANPPISHIIPLLDLWNMSLYSSTKPTPTSVVSTKTQKQSSEFLITIFSQA